jgi:hypothetical protein
VATILVVRHQLPDVAGELPVVVADDGPVPDCELGVVVTVPAAFIEVVVFGEVVAVLGEVADDDVSLDEVDEVLPEAVNELDAGDEVSVDAVVVEGVVVVVVELGVALAPELLYAELGLLQPARAAAMATARTQGMMRFMLSPISISGVGSFLALHNVCQ